jgi:hypothetical protein
MRKRRSKRRTPMKTETICRELPGDEQGAERPRYFPRQLITADDLILEQEYFRNKLRRHNRLLRGWGVVCGAKVCPLPQATGSPVPWKVKVAPGYILGPYGDEILIDCERTVDLRTNGISGVTGEPCADVPDPWCSEVFEKRDDACFFVAVKYQEVLSRPVRVQPVGCGCDDTQCEYSRWRDGYEIGVLCACPESHKPSTPPKEDLFKGELLQCPPCPTEPWVVLAEVSVRAEGTVIIDNSCRRMVASFGRFWRQCDEDSSESKS